MRIQSSFESSAQLLLKINLTVVVNVDKCKERHLQPSDFISKMVFQNARQQIGTLRKRTTATATKTSPNQRLNEQNNGSASALCTFVHFLAVLCKSTTSNDQFPSFLESVKYLANFSYFYLEASAFAAYSAGAHFYTDTLNRSI